MPGGEKLRRKRDQAIAALLTEPTVEAAATRIGVTSRTLNNWMNLPDFREQYRQARMRLLDSAIADLQRTAGEATAALRRALTCGKSNVEVRAAVAVLEQASKGLQLIELQQRVTALEERLINQTTHLFNGANRS